MTRMMFFSKPRAFVRPLLRLLKAAFPIRAQPIPGSHMRQLVKDRLEINLSVTELAKAIRPIDPFLVSTVDDGWSALFKLGIFYVKGSNASWERSTNER